MNELKKLIDVKTIVTFAIVGVIVYLAVIGKIAPADIKEIGIIIITFFFAKKVNDEIK